MRDLPRKTASLDAAGFGKLLQKAKEDTDFAHAVADELEASPRAVLTRMFRLSAKQTEAIAGTPDQVLLIRALPLIERLRSGNLEGLTYDPGSPRKSTSDTAEPLWYCDCKISGGSGEAPK
jgi:hypothetical protein